MKLQLIKFARCVDSLPEVYEEWHVAEPKLDGGRYALYIGDNVDPYGRQEGNTYLSRNESEIDGRYVDRTKNIPHVTEKKYPGLKGTLLDTEAFHTDLRTTTSIMGSSAKVAVEQQKKIGKLTVYAFDILYYKGRSVMGLELWQRRELLVKAVKEMKNRYVKVMEQRVSDFYAWFLELVEAGGEGLIIKDLRCGYGSGWAKKKKSYDISCIVTGFKPGNGKYEGHVGSLELSVYGAKGKLQPVGYCAGFDEGLVIDISKNPKKYLRMVVDVFAHEWSGTRLRHTTFHRFRSDVTKKTVTLEKMLDDLKLNALVTRAKQGKR